MLHDGVTQGAPDIVQKTITEILELEVIFINQF